METPKVYTRQRSDGKYEAFHVLIKTNGKKVKMYEISFIERQAKEMLVELMKSMYRPESPYRIVKQ